jgi:hypothetical protein
MTHSESSSAETSQAAIAAETPEAVPPETYSGPTPRDVAAANARQAAIKSLEDTASSKRSLAALLDEAKALLETSNPKPSETTRGRLEATARARLADIKQATSGVPPTQSVETVNRLERSGHTTRIGRRALLQLVAALGAAVIGYVFGHVVAGSDTEMIFFAGTVAVGLFLVFSAFATRMNRRWRPRL